MSKHTPGPWEIQWTDMWCPETDDWIPEGGFAEHIRASGDGELYERESICGTCDGCNLIKAANARLIAAAPDLLKALQAMLDCCYDIERDIETEDAVEEARAAIAKAIGDTK